MAKSIGRPDGPKKAALEWTMDIQEHEYKDTEALHRALCWSPNLVTLNSLSLKNIQESNIKEALQRDRLFTRTDCRNCYLTCEQEHRLPVLSFQGQGL